MATKGPSLPYAHLNLRRNPFGQAPPEAVRRLAVVDPTPAVTEVRERLARGTPTPWALQLVGPSGCGKSTRLRLLETLLPGAATLAWTPGWTPAWTPGGWPPAPPGRLLLLDDVHMMGHLRLRRVLRGRVAVVLASHVDRSAGLRRCGFETRTVSVADRITPTRLEAILDRRVEWARRGEGPTPRVATGAIRDLLARHGHDVRAILRELYAWVQSLPAPATLSRAAGP
ncbi:MAG TPA: hypothetical protein VGA70_08580 [Longimicrobiales bacterium]